MRVALSGALLCNVVGNPIADGMSCSRTWMILLEGAPQTTYFSLRSTLLLVE